MSVQEQDKYRCISAIKILNLFGPAQFAVLTDAAIAPLTTVAGLRALVPTAAVIQRLGPNEIHQIRACCEAIDEMSTATGLGIFTDTNIAAANTFANVRGLIVTAAALSVDELDDVTRQDSAFQYSGNALSPDIS